MDRKKQIAALTDDEGERLLLAQACERLTRAAIRSEEHTSELQSLV